MELQIRNLQLGRYVRPPRLKSRLTKIHQYDRGLWTAAAAGAAIGAAAAVSVSALGMPTGLGAAFDLTAALLLNAVSLGLFASLSAVLLALFGLRLPRYSMGTVLYTALLVFLVLFSSEMGPFVSLTLSILYTAICTGAGALIGSLFFRHTRKRGAIVLFLLAAGTFSWVQLTSNHSTLQTGGSFLLEASTYPSSSVGADPSETGPYSFTFFTYGSGEDIHRSEYGEKVNLQSQTVNGSSYISDWPWLRKAYWGFGRESLPLNGRVWLPEGKGPFPLVLMVHGNHLMEDFSEEGYDYLGELLASRGFAAVSLDENFLNYSVWSGIPEKDMLARAWLILKHLEQIDIFNRTTGTPFTNKIDMMNVALLGHSRGGQAAAMAADRDRWFAADSSLLAPSRYKVQAVAALAPTDFVIDRKSVQLENVDYFTMQGANDADLVSFFGDRLYERTEVAWPADRFKAAIYIEGANHSQFNRSWGRADLALPVGLFLNKSQLLDGDEQRRIAETYISAFMESALHGNAVYRDLFLNYRTGHEFLPETRYFTRYEDGSFTPIARFDEAAETAGMEWVAPDMSAWGIQEELDRQGNGKENRGMVVEWEQKGSYRIISDSPFLSGHETRDEAEFMFSMAELQEDLKENKGGESMPLPLQLEVELSDKNGNKAKLPLNRYIQPEALPETKYTWLPWLDRFMDEGEYSHAVEPFFQTYRIPLSHFEREETGFSLDQWNRITFSFQGGSGRVMLDDIGIRWTK